MSETPAPLTIAPEQLAELRRRRRARTRGRRQVAIIGMACRFPGAPNPGRFWTLLEAGANAVTRGRPRSGQVGPEEPLWGGYLSDLDRFDPAFFRIAPIEAELMDPQQRLLLEISWEALENAGIDPSGLRGSRAAVYVGVSNNDYRLLMREPSLYAASGNSVASAIGRVAFTLGLNGPAITVDTACSSSLVSLHLAITALQRGEADLALGGGVNAILSGELHPAFERAGMLAGDGRCKTFDAAADGFVRSEGCGILVLKRLADAERDGDRILAVLLGSAVNQDGASAGLTVPNGPAQEKVIREALERAEVAPSGVDYLEAHGTGTELGDPIEVRAAAAVYGEGRDPERPLLTGSVKTNIGHLESAAGIAGVMKTVLAMRHGLIPKHLHFERPNPRMDWNRLPVHVTSEVTEWPSGPDRPVRAGVSSFGLSGTNAHLILEAYGSAGEEAAAPVAVPLPGKANEAPEGRRYRVLPLSGRSRGALAELAGRYREWMDAESGESSWERLSNAVWTAGVGRSHFGERAGVVFSSAAELREQLGELESGGEGTGGTPGKVGFLFTGQGSQWAGMGRALYAREPVFRGVLERAEEVIREERGASLLGVMFGESGALDATEWTQPALYALQGALVALWKSLGIEPSAVLGHSVGEIAAAHAAGVFGFEAGLLFAARRGALMGALPGDGGMVAVFAPEEELTSWLTGELALAADNGTHQVVSGPRAEVEELVAELGAAGIRSEPLNTSHAFHSPLMDGALRGIGEAAAEARLNAPSVPLVTNVTGRVSGPGELVEGAYWRRQARSRVRFAAGVRTLFDLECGFLIEIGPRGVLGPLAAFSWPQGSPTTAFSLAGSRTADDLGFARAVGRVYEAGLGVTFDGLFAGEARRRVALPTYPFQRERYWVKGNGRDIPVSGHPLLGVRRDLPDGGVSFEISTRELQWLKEQRTFGRPVLPGSFYAVDALAALAAGESEAPRGLVADLCIERPLVLPEDLSEPDSGIEGSAPERTVQFVLGGEETGKTRRFEVFSRESGDGPWTRHAAGRAGLDDGEGSPRLSRTELARLTAGLSPLAADEVYRRLGAAGFAPGPSLRGVVRAWSGTRAAVAELSRPEGSPQDSAAALLVLLEGCLQVLGSIESAGDVEGGQAWVPVGWESLRIRNPFPAQIVCHAALREGPSAGTRLADLRFYAPDGAGLGELSGLSLRPASRSALLAASAGVKELLYGLEWRSADASHGADPGPTPATGPDPGVFLLWPREAAAGAAAGLVAELEGRGQRVIPLGAGPGAGNSTELGDPLARESWRQVFAGLEDGVEVRGVLHAGALAGPGDEAEVPVDAALNLSLSALALVQGLRDAEIVLPLGISFLTSGGQVVSGERVGGLEGSVLWGFARTAAREMEGLPIRLFDLDPGDATPAAALADEILFPGRENEIAWRGGLRTVPRMVRRTAESAEEKRDPVRGDRSYLVTGAFSGLGLRVAGWLADLGAGAVILSGRRKPGAPVRKEAERMLACGAEVRLEVVDVTDRSALERLVSSVPESGLPPLGGVVHCAGVLADRSLPNQDRESFERVFAPKVLGGWNLHLATLEAELDFFVLFSSFSGLAGTAGQANYAAANAFLDQLARWRRAVGLPGQAIAWGAWSEVGAAAVARRQLEKRFDDSGAGWMTPEQALAVLDRLLRDGVETSAVAPVDWEVAGAGGLPPLFEEFAPDPAGRTGRAEGALPDLGGLAPADRETWLLGFLQEQVRAVLRLSAPPAPDVGFFELGMDSLTAVELRNRMNRAFAGSLAVENRVVFDYPDINRLAGYLLARLGAAPDAVLPAPIVEPRVAEEPIAIIGMAGRFPGADDVRTLWARLAAGDDLITAGRTDGPTINGAGPDATPGGYVTGVDRFDAAFFRIPPVEAELMDPQQRLLLETSWEALEDAATAPGRLRGRRVGVYAGITNRDYERLLPLAGDDPVRSLYLATGNTFAAAIGRISFALGFQGPAIAVDTACSSSLVAIHQAVAGLARGEAELALAGGVNAILLPEVTQALAGGMLAPDGRCKTFDAAADGYGRGEGCGILVLKRLTDAERDGDRILAVILGSAVNQDGASAGLTVPNGPAQEAVIREAVSRAGIAPSSVDYLEAHGTGTELGDPIEVGAAAAVYGEGRKAECPLLIGSVKTNIGHLESAAGIAGVIKAVLAMGHRLIPRHLHFDRPNPGLDWDRLPVRVTKDATPWPEVPDRPMRAGVSSFGFSGTNAHLILEAYEPPEGRARFVVSAGGGEPEAAPPTTREVRLLPLSGRTGKALSELAARYLEWLPETSGEWDALSDAAFSAGVGRSHFGVRAGLVFSETGELREQLKELASRADRQSSASLAEAASVSGKTAFLFTGQGSQWAGMGRNLYEREPAVRAILDRADAVVREERGTRLLPVMFGESGDLDATEWTQPALFALAGALVARWRSIGVEPDLVLGHSVGEIAAAHAAGVFGFEEGMRFAVRRGALMGSLPRDGKGAGGMLAVFAPGARVAAALSEVNAGAGGVAVELAADNGSHQVVSGPVKRLRALEKHLAGERIRAERLRTSHAFHSGLMDPVLGGLEEAARELGSSPGAVPLVTNVNGRVAESGEVEDASYWRRQARAPVRFATGVRAAAEAGCRILIEIGPRAVVGPLASLAWPETPSEPKRVLASLEGEDGPDEAAFLRAAARAYEAGLPVRFEGLFAGERRLRVSLPTYPFERDRHWVRNSIRASAGAGNPLLGMRRELPSGEVSFETGIRNLGWTAEHRVFGRAVAPGAFHGAQALEALRQAGPSGSVSTVSEMRFELPLMLPDSDGDAPERTVQLVVGRPGENGDRSFDVFSRGPEDPKWVRHAAGRVGCEESPEAGGRSAASLAGLKSALKPIEPRELYGRLRSAGLEHGPSFRGVARLWTGSREALGEVRLPQEVEPAAVQTVMLDACLQVLGGVGLRDPQETTWLPIGWERLSVRATFPERVWCHAELRESGGGDAQADLKFHAEDGEFLGELRGLRLQRAARAIHPAAGRTFRVDWRTLPGRRDADFLPAPELVVASTRKAVDRAGKEGLTLERMSGLDRGLEELAAGYALRALGELGWERRPGALDRPEDLANGLGVMDSYRRLFGRLFAMLAQAGVVARSEGEQGFTAQFGPADPVPEALRDPDRRARQLRRRHPEGELEIRLLRRCGGSLAQVLTGRAHALRVLNAEAPTLFDVSRDSPGQNAALRCMVEVVAALARGLPAGERLRVLEVGAGAGAATAELLKVLPAGRTDYTVTDLLETWFEDMKARFGGSEAGVRYRLLDLERDPVEQGFEPQGYDLVLSSNSLHPTRDLAESLGNVRRVLAPSGAVVVLEGMGGRGWMDLTFGLLEAWWRFEGGYRAGQGLAEPEGWRRAFSDAGYPDLRFLSNGDAAPGSCGATVARIGPTVQGVMVARGPAEPHPDPGVWVIAADRRSPGAARELVAKLEDLGQRVAAAPAADSGRGFRSSASRAGSLSRRAWRKLLRSRPEGLPLQGVVLASGLEDFAAEPSAAELAARVSWMAESAGTLARELEEAGVVPRLGTCLVTRGGQVVDGETGPDPAGAVLWGCGRSLMREHGQLRVRLVDLDPAEQTADGLVGELLLPGREPEVALRGRERLVPRLVRQPAPDSAPGESPARRDRTYLVTGGIAAPALRVAGWLAEGGAGAIVLAGARAFEDLVAEAVEPLRERGAQVRVSDCDPADRAALDRMLREIADSDLPPLGGVFCAAFEGEPSAGGDRKSLRKALARRVRGAWHLHRATRDLPLDRFVLLTSEAGVVPDRGQAAEASASAFLDHLARWRRARGLPGQAIGWGAWKDRRPRRPGDGTSGGTSPRDRGLTAEEGAASFNRLVREDLGSALVTAADWSTALTEAPWPRLEELVIPGIGSGGGGEHLTARVREAPSGDRGAVLGDFLGEQVRRLLGLASPPPADVGFFELGMNSLMAVELRNRIQREFAGEGRVPDTVVLDYPSIARLAEFLARQFSEPVEMAAVPAVQVAIRPRDEAVAVIGMSCRFPGGADPAKFWSRLEAGADLVADGRPDGLMVGAEHLELAYGGYVGGMDLFDAEFFRIAPVEAELMDPQQRMLLETSWAALEDAGVDPGALRGTRTGVYGGIMNADYAQILQAVDRDPAQGVYLATGAGSAAAIGRVSFALGFQGPAVAVDTACSSSLVAIHQAAAGLLRGESDLALAGGVNAILTATTTRICVEAGMLSPSGRCRTFDAEADGFVRGEGCGMLVLKRLADAERHGDRILGVLLGSAVNQDGASAGFTVPNGPAQEQVIREALSRAGIAPSSVDYLECHGTGTELGDPIEVQAAAAVYGEGREPGHPLLMGSVKANIGHLESAAGVAGVIKVLLAIREGVIPRQLHFDNPNPRIDWERLPVRVASETTAWPAIPDRPVRAGVSSFGYSGTNAHLILEGHGSPGEIRGAPFRVALEEPLPFGAQLEPRRYRLLPLSGRNGEALAELARRYDDWLDGVSPERLADAAWTAGAGRSHFRERAGLVFAEAAELRGQLDAVAVRGARTEVDRVPVPGKVAFLFTGQGSQWAGMGRDLYEREPVARAVLDRAEAVIRAERGDSLLEAMFGSGRDLGATEWTQPALFALQGALLDLWKSVGIEPHAVLGHSVGEIAAASAAGVFGFEEGLRFAARRGEVMGSLPRKGEGAGGMLAVFAPAGSVAATLCERAGRRNGSPLDLAADNGAHQVVSGPLEALGELEERFRSEGVRTERLETSHAFHSYQMEPILDALEEAAAALTRAAPRIPLVSGETGEPAGAEAGREPGYWRRQARVAVRFARGVQTLAESGVRVLVEIGPRGVLTPMAALAWPEQEGHDAGPRTIPSQTGSGTPGDASFLRAVAEAYEAGLPVSFAGLFAGESRRRVSVPGYPFQRKRHWAKARRRAPADGHPLLGDRHELASGEVTFETVFSSVSPAWLSDHRVFDRVVAPGTLFGVQALLAARTTGGHGNSSLGDFRIERPLVLADESSPTGPDSRTVQVVLRQGLAAGSQSFEVFSRGEEQESWVRHATGRVVAGRPPPDTGGSALELERLRETLPEIPLDGLYARLEAAGLRYGPAFRGMVRLWGGKREAVAALARPEGLGRDHGVIHPALLDSCLHALGGVELPGGEAQGPSWLPVGWERLWLTGPLPERLLCLTQLREGASPDGPLRTVLKADFSLHAEDGTVVGGVRGLELRRASRPALLAASASVEDLLYEVSWRDSARTGQGAFRPAGFLPAPATVLQHAEIRSGNPARGRTAGMERGLEHLARAEVIAACDALRWNRRRGTRFQPEALRRRLKVVEQHRRLFFRLLAMLAAAGVVRAGEGDSSWTVVLGSSDPLPNSFRGPAALAERLLARHPEGTAEISLLRRCGAQLAEVLRGRAEGLDLLFGDTAGVATLYRESPAYRALNRVVAEAVAVLTAGLPEGERLRVLEVGAGTGGTTEPVLPALPAGRTEYAFTDISAGFFADAENRFRDAPVALEYRTLDIERDPGDQGFDLHRYDLVLAANVLHATRDIGAALENCRRLLGPGGQLLVLEGTGRQGWLDLTFGLLPGWWRFDDGYREDHPLVPPSAWRRAFADTDYGEAEILAPFRAGGSGGEDECSEGGGAAVMLARAPEQIRPDPGVWVAWPPATKEDEAGMAAGLFRELEERGQQVVTLGGAGRDASGGPAPDGFSRESWRDLFRSLPASPPLRGVLHLSGMAGSGGDVTGDEMAAGLERNLRSALALTQGLYDAGPGSEAPVWLVTRGAQVLPGETGGELAGSALPGFGRVLAREFEGRARLLDLDPAGEIVISRLADELLFPDREPEVLLRGESRLVPRLARLPAASGSDPAREPVRRDRTYLVTGGLGGIGLEVADWLVRSGAGAVVLNGRREPEAWAAEAVERLRAEGTQVRVELADVAEGAAVQGLLDRIPDSGLPPLGGVIHSVGALADRAIPNQDWANFERILWPKLLGGWHLHRATLGMDLELFVLFSSFAGLVGVPGQANYASANVFLDQLARYRRALGLPGQVVAWGGWSGRGEAGDISERLQGGMEAVGAGWMTPGQGIGALARLVRDDVDQCAVGVWDWEVPGAGAPPFFDDLVSDREGSRRSEAGDLVRNLREAEPANRKRLLVGFLQDQVQSVLRLPAAPSPEAGFFDVGMDSLMAVELRNRVNRALAGVYSAPSTAVLDYPTIDGLAAHLAVQLGTLAGRTSDEDRRGPEPDAGAEYERLRRLEEKDLLDEVEAFLDSEP